MLRPHHRRLNHTTTTSSIRTNPRRHRHINNILQTATTLFKQSRRMKMRKRQIDAMNHNLQVTHDVRNLNSDVINPHRRKRSGSRRHHQRLT
ncbi:hypothetical protein HanRHA438_Chr15g0695201 [Helianthus annuus]|nr:hypothetical protein HanRHA438_Chr15g0695201 [Helianthus annuus]